MCVKLRENMDLFTWNICIGVYDAFRCKLQFDINDNQSSSFASNLPQKHKIEDPIKKSRFKRHQP